MSNVVPEPPPPPSNITQQSPETGDQTRTSLFSQVTSFNRQSLKNTETTIKTEDGKRLQETHDECGNYKRVVTNAGDYGFIPDIRLDLQVGEVRDNLIIASQDVAADEGVLQKYGVTHILNLGSYVKNYFPNKIQYRNIRLNDTIDVNAMQFFDIAFKFIDEGRSVGSVLIHCNAGVSRASTFMIGYLMNREKMPLDEAFPYVKSKRPAIQPNAGFLQQLRMYNEKLGFGKSKI